MPGFDWLLPFAFTWGIVLVAMLIGWGTLLGAAQSNVRTSSPGLAAALGTSIFIFLSGQLLLPGCFSRAFVGLFIALGLVLFAKAILKRQISPPRLWPADSDSRIMTLLAALFVVFCYLDGLCDHVLNPFDDYAAYLNFPHIMFDTGSLIDPFSTRRMAGLGGQSALDTLVFLVLPWKYGNLLDAGVGFLITIALVAEGIKGSSTWAFPVRATVVWIAVLIPITRVNITSGYTTVFLLLALLQTLDTLVLSESPRVKNALLVALLAAALATLRVQTFFAVSLLLPACFAYRLAANLSQWRETLRLGFLTAAALLLFLFCWMAVLQLSSGTFLYPILPGNQQPGFNMFDGGQTWGGFLVFLSDFYIGKMYLFIITPAFFIRDKRTRGLALIIGCCVLTISLAMAVKFSTSDAPNLYRYLMPQGLAFVLYCFNVVANEVIATADRRGWRVPSPLVMAVCYAALLVTCSRFQYPDLETRVGRIAQEFMPYGYWEVTSDSDAMHADYARAFSHVPPGTSILAAVDYPFEIDYHAHHIFSVDQPGVTSPSPGLPYFQGPEALKSYLLKLGIDHIACVPYVHGESLYGDMAEHYLRRNTVLTFQYSKYMRDLMKNINRLASTNPVIYQSPFLHIIELSSRGG